MSIENDPNERAATRKCRAVRQHRIILSNGVRANENRVVFVPEMVHPSTRLRSCDPPRISGARSNASIQRACELEVDKRAPISNEMDVLFILSLGRVPEQPYCHIESGIAKFHDPAAGDLWIRVFDSHDDAPNAGSDERVSAWRRARVVGVGFKRYICGGAPRSLARSVKRLNLGMSNPRRFVMAFTGYFSRFRDDHAADERPRAHKAYAL